MNEMRRLLTLTEGLFNPKAGMDETTISEDKQDKLLADLKKRFNIDARRGDGWDKGALVWSGEDAYMPDGSPAFDYYSYDTDPREKVYQMGVHKELVTWADKHGLHWECNDPGTYLLYDSVQNNEQPVEEADPNYPENIRSFDHDPRSPFYDEPPEVGDSDIEDAGYVLGSKIISHVLTTDFSANKVSDEVQNIRCRAIVRGEHIAQNGPITHDSKDHQLLMDLLKDPKTAANNILSTNFFTTFDHIAYGEDAVAQMEEAMNAMVHALTSHNDVDLEKAYYSFTDAFQDGAEKLEKIESKIRDNYEPDFDEPDMDRDYDY